MDAVLALKTVIVFIDAKGMLSCGQFDRQRGQHQDIRGRCRVLRRKFINEELNGFVGQWLEVTQGMLS
ncbi:hypothetical protein D3C80_1946640 [compost metagenome]